LRRHGFGCGSSGSMSVHNSSSMICLRISSALLSQRSRVTGCVTRQQPHELFLKPFLRDCRLRQCAFCQRNEQLGSGLDIFGKGNRWCASALEVSLLLKALSTVFREPLGRAKEKSDSVRHPRRCVFGLRIK
jgi:hypothetical protein